MSTRGNVLFVDHYWLDENKITKEDIINDHKVLTGVIENSYKIYIHSDMYPSGALNNLQEYLQLDGAKHRATDASYLSAWYVGWECLEMSRWTRRFTDNNFDAKKCKNPSLKNFKESRDFFGIGLLNEPTDWASYSYIILPKTPLKNGIYQYDENSFDILIFNGGKFKEYLGEFNSEDNLEDFKIENENKEWYY